MGPRRLLAILLGAASLLGVGIYARRGRSRERLDLYFADGSVASLDGASPEAAGLLPFAHDALAAGRS